MSSDRKDARWQAGYRMLDAIAPSRDFIDDLDYETREAILNAAELLNNRFPANIPILAAEWRREAE